VRSRLAVLTALLVVGGLAVAPAAGAVDLLDRKKLQKSVQASVAAAYPDLPVTKVSCPKKVRMKAGVTATCAVTAGAYPLAMLVTVVDKSGNVTIASTQTVMAKALVEGLVANNATLPATADCGPEPYLVKVPGESFTCTARFADGSAQQVTVTPNDTAGNVTITAVAATP
jgi:hypothetical protein